MNNIATAYRETLTKLAGKVGKQIDKAISSGVFHKSDRTRIRATTGNTMRRLRGELLIGEKHSPRQRKVEVEQIGGSIVDNSAKAAVADRMNKLNDHIREASESAYSKYVTQQRTSRNIGKGAAIAAGVGALGYGAYRLLKGKKKEEAK